MEEHDGMLQLLVMGVTTQLGGSVHSMGCPSPAQFTSCAVRSKPAWSSLWKGLKLVFCLWKQWQRVCFF